MEVKKCTQNGNELHINFEVLNSINNINYLTKISPEYVINGLIIFQVKVNVARHSVNTSCSEYNGSVFIRFVKTLQSDKFTYALKCSSDELGLKDNTFLSDDSTWRQVHEYSKKYTNSVQLVEKFDLIVVLDLHSKISLLAPLHEDTDLTDIELHAEDGSVHVHKAILAAYSPMLRAMLARESKEGIVKVPGTKETLQHLKDYTYSDKLPETGLQPLLLLASYYMMEDLEQKCSFKLLTNLSAHNAFELAEFAAKNKTKKLFLAIMVNVQRGVIKVEDMDKDE